MKCLKCNIEYEPKRKNSRRKFCSSSCSAKYNNEIRYSKNILIETDIKKCKVCNQEKSVLEFNKRKGSVDGYRNDCKKCQVEKSMINPKKKENNKRYYQNNKEKIKEKVRIYQQNNTQKKKENKKAYQSNNRDKINESRKNRYYTDPVYKLERNIRGAISKALKRNGYSKKSRTFEILGCTFEEFKIYIEKQFQEGMSWKNHGEWHLDHKIPISWANNEVEVYELSKFTNFQPLWADENMKKKNYYSN